MCKCVRAPARAPPGEGPGGAAAGGGRAAPLLSVSGLRGPRRVLPAAGVPRASRLPACHFSRRARPWAGAGGARGSLLRPAGARVPAVGSGTLPPAIESGLSVRALSGSACPEARRLGGRLGPRPRGRPRRRRAWCPPAGGSTWSGAPRSAGCAGRSRGDGSPARPRRRAPAPAGSPARPPPPPPAVARIPSLRLLW